ncbi:MAG TPA: hypothetical protein VK718_01870 [Ferruginibacter sp.]|jgi:hypothetical protein|nr:hypothetical protein [Ferruginibacter sp.]
MRKRRRKIAIKKTSNTKIVVACLLTLLIQVIIGLLLDEYALYISFILTTLIGIFIWFFHRKLKRFSIGLLIIVGLDVLWCTYQMYNVAPPTKSLLQDREFIREEDVEPRN